MHFLPTPNFEDSVSVRGERWFVELLREAAGMVSGLEKYPISGILMFFVRNNLVISCLLLSHLMYPSSKVI